MATLNTILVVAFDAWVFSLPLADNELRVCLTSSPEYLVNTHTFRPYTFTVLSSVHIVYLIGGSLNVNFKKLLLNKLNFKTKLYFFAVKFVSKSSARFREFGVGPSDHSSLTTTAITSHFCAFCKTNFFKQNFCFCNFQTFQLCTLISNRD